MEAYGRGLEDLLRFFQAQRPPIDPVQATRVDLGKYVNDLASRPGRRGSNVIQMDSGAGLAHQTMHLRVTAARLYYDHLMDVGVRTNNPVGRGKYTPKRNEATRVRVSTGTRPLLKRRPARLPWIPNDDEFIRLLRSLSEETPRNQALLMLMYDGAMRREEVVGVELEDFDWSSRELTLRPEICKNEGGRLVLFTKPTALRLKQHLEQRRKTAPDSRLLFVSESNRNRKAGLSPDMVNKIVKQVADRVGLPRLHPHTFRHLRLTHMARCGVAEQVIAQYAGHRSIETTRIYIHLSGREISAAVAQKMDDFHRWVESSLVEAAE